MFTVQNLQINRGSTTANAQGKFTTTIHTYADQTQTVANIKLLFPPYLGQGANQDAIILGDHMLVLGSDTSILCKILSLSPFTLDVDLFSGASGLSIGSPVAATDGNAAKITGEILQMEQADATHPGILTNLSQEVGGTKTFKSGPIVIPQNDFSITGLNFSGVTVKAQNTNSGMAVVTDNPAAFLGYGFGTVNLGGAYGGLVFSESGFGPTPVTFLAMDGIIGFVMEVTGNMVFPVSIQTDIINENSLNSGTTINGTNVKGTTIKLADINVFWDNGVVIADTVLFSFDANDYLSYNKTTNILSANIASTSILDVSSSEITANQDVKIIAGKKLLANSIDSITAVPLVLGTTNATEIDLTPVAIANNGIKLGTAGGTPALLNHYEEYTHSSTFTNNTVTSPAVTVKIIRIGNIVTLHIQTVVSVAGQVAPAAEFVTDTPLPARFIPTVRTSGYFRISNAGVYSDGEIEVGVAGNIHIYNNSDHTTTYTAAVANGFFTGTHTYLLT